jgi:hypothetical protein
MPKVPTGTGLRNEDTLVPVLGNLRWNRMEAQKTKKPAVAGFSGDQRTLMEVSGSLDGAQERRRTNDVMYCFYWIYIFLISMMY